MTESKYKIAIYVAELDVRGGTHKQVLKLAQHLKNVGHGVCIFTPCYSLEKTYPEFSQLEVIFLRTKSLRRIRGVNLVMQLLDQFRLYWKSCDFDIVNTHDQRTKLFILLHALLGKSKQIWQINDIEPAFGLGNSKNSTVALAGANRFFARLAASLVDRILVNVTKNKDRVNRYLKQEASVVYCGVDFLPQREDIPTVDGVLKIVSTGVVLRYRNYESIIDAAALIYRSINKVVKIDVIGDCRYEQEYVAELKQYARDLAVNIRFAGTVSQNELYSIYGDAHVFAFVNVDQSWGLAVFEAASMGLPVVLSKSVGAIELLESSGGVKIVDPQSSEDIAEAIIEITRSDESYKRTCFAVSRSVRGMSWDTMYSKKVESIFRDIMRGA